MTYTRPPAVHASRVDPSVRCPPSAPREAPIRRSLVALALAAVVLTACPSAAQRQPEAPDEGIQFTGRIGTQQLNVSHGAPQAHLGDCDPNEGTDRDLCIVTRTLEGQRIAVVIENPDVLEAGAVLPVVEPPREGCADGCDEIRDGVVVELRRGADRSFADSGNVTVREADDRYAASFVLNVDRGTLTGRFNVAP